jgi:hypothetical protein
MMGSVSMIAKKKISVVALFLACQRKILRILLQKDISENQELFDELARL